MPPDQAHPPMPPQSEVAQPTWTELKERFAPLVAQHDIPEIPDPSSSAFPEFLRNLQAADPVLARTFVSEVRALKNGMSLPSDKGARKRRAQAQTKQMLFLRRTADGRVVIDKQKAPYYGIGVLLIAGGILTVVYALPNLKPGQSLLKSTSATTNTTPDSQPTGDDTVIPTPPVSDSTQHALNEARAREKAQQAARAADEARRAREAARANEASTSTTPVPPPPASDPASPSTPQNTYPSTYPTRPAQAVTPPAPSRSEPQAWSDDHATPSVTRAGMTATPAPRGLASSAYSRPDAPPPTAITPETTMPFGGTAPVNTPSTVTLRGSSTAPATVMSGKTSAQLPAPVVQPFGGTDPEPAEPQPPAYTNPPALPTGTTTPPAEPTATPVPTAISTMQSAPQENTTVTTQAAAPTKPFTSSLVYERPKTNPNPSTPPAPALPAASNAPVSQAAPSNSSAAPTILPAETPFGSSTVSPSVKLGATGPFKDLQRVPGTLVTAIYALTGGSVPVLVVSSDGGSFVGVGTINGALSRVDMTFRRYVSPEGKVYEVDALAYTLEGKNLTQGIPANIETAAPTLAVDAAQNGLSALQQYLMQSLSNAKGGTTVITGGSNTISGDALPPLWQVIAAGIGSTFKMPASTQSIVRIAKVNSDTSMTLIVGLSGGQP